MPIVSARIASPRSVGSEEAIAQLREAVMRRTSSPTTSLRDWFFPVRHMLGAQLLAANRPVRRPEAVYREDLLRNPSNGWSLYGLEWPRSRRSTGRWRPRASMQQLRAAWKTPMSR